jgi:uncharacterized membrane protein YfcA
VILAGVATLIAAAIQSATGLGFAMIAAPALLAVLEPREAVTILLALSLLVSVLLLFGERRPLAIRRPDLTLVLIAALPGLALGVLVLEAVTKEQLQVLTGTVVILTAAVQLRAAEPPATSRAEGRVAAHPASAAGVGVLVGGLTTSTTVNGPPLALWLFARGAAPAEVRDTLAAAFLALNVLGLGAVAVTGEGLAGDAGYLALLVPLTAVGWLAGRPAFERLRGRGFRAASLLVVLAAGVASLLAGLI